MDRTTLGCKEVLVQFLSPCLVMFLLSWSEIGNPQYVYNIKTWDRDFISNFWGFIFWTPSRDLNLEVLLTVEKRLKGQVLEGSNNTLLTPSYSQNAAKRVEPSIESSRRNPTNLMSKAPGPNLASSLCVSYERWNPNHDRIASAHTTRQQTSNHKPEQSFTLITWN